MEVEVDDDGGAKSSNEMRLSTVPVEWLDLESIQMVTDVGDRDDDDGAVGGLVLFEEAIIVALMVEIC